jgi:hypothetical protein
MGEATEGAETYYIQLGPNEKVRQWVICLYGPSGVGKTLLAAQGPKPLFLSCERGQYGGLVSARQYSPKQVVIKDYSSFLGVLPKLRKGAGTDFELLVLDSVTAMTKIVMKNVLAQSGREYPQFQDWGLAMERVRTLINSLSDLNAHIILIATEQIIKDEVTGKLMGLPNVPGKLAHELPAGVDICLHMTTKASWDEKGNRGVNYVMTSTPDETWTAKDCSTTLPPSMITPKGESAFKHLEHLFKEPA